MVLFENPFHTTSDKANNFIILSLGHKEDHLRLSTPSKEENSLVPLKHCVVCPACLSSPLMALV